MKIVSNKIIPMLVLALFFTGCGLDNYDEPTSKLTGQVMYNGEALQLRGTDERVRLQLYQDGYANYGAIELFVGQDGSYSAMLFNGEYKMVTRDNNGPWVNSRDTIFFTVKGNTVQNMEVTPYYTISNANMTLSGSKVAASLTVNQVVADRGIDRIILLLNKTQFVDDDIQIQRVDYTGDEIQGSGSRSFDFDLNEAASNAKFLFGRICVWPSGADQGIYSPVFSLR